MGSFADPEALSHRRDEDAAGSTARRPRSQGSWMGKQNRDFPGVFVRIKKSQTGAAASKCCVLIYSWDV